MDMAGEGICLSRNAERIANPVASQTNCVVSKPSNLSNARHSGNLSLKPKLCKVTFSSKLSVQVTDAD